MSDWQALLGIRWEEISQNACDRSGECCRGAGQLRPWEALLTQAANGEVTARNFLNQFVPYADAAHARQAAPHAWEASWAIAQERGAVEADLVLYRCRFLRGQNECLIYEDRPTLCRDFPESPFGAIPSCCGYTTVATQCRMRFAEVRAGLERELAEYRALLAQPAEESSGASNEDGTDASGVV